MNPFIGLKQLLAELSVARFRVVTRAVDDLGLPWYQGSALRGAFGRAFRNVCCSMGKAECTGCVLVSACAYARVFEAGPADGGDRFKYRDVPRPFIIQPPVQTTTSLKTGENLDFHLVLIGQAADLLPYFVVSLREMTIAGLGYRVGAGGRGRLRLECIEALSPDGQALPVYDGQDQSVRPGRWGHPAVRWYLPEDATGNGAVTVRFMTMTRLVSEGRLQDRPEFELLVRSLLRRVTALVYCHCNRPVALDFPGLLAAAGQVNLVEDRTSWVDWSRYSSRQRTSMKLGGIVGDVRYAGPHEILDGFAPLLAAGKLVHVGKNPTFGLGRYDVVFRSGREGR